MNTLSLMALSFHMKEAVMAFMVASKRDEDYATCRMVS